MAYPARLDVANLLEKGDVPGTGQSEAATKPAMLQPSNDQKSTFEVSDEKGRPISGSKNIFTLE